MVLVLKLHHKEQIALGQGEVNLPLKEIVLKDILSAHGECLGVGTADIRLGDVIVCPGKIPFGQ
tara:strand:- start:96 stop:287 length:192 start_codon:yes stop_codon:yes gene_type:complete